jgi:hypothetical protein
MQPADDTNNVEQVTINSTQVINSTLFSVHVRGTNVVSSGGQNFSLVVNGFFKRLPLQQCSGPSRLSLSVSLSLSLSLSPSWVYVYQ